MSTYLDAVLNQHMVPLVNDTPEKVIAWLGDVTCHSSWQVAVGRDNSLVSVEAYIAAHKERVEAKRTEKHAKITEIVTRAMAAQAKATYHSDTLGELDIVAKNAADEIINLFN